MTGKRSAATESNSTGLMGNCKTSAKMSPFRALRALTPTLHRKCHKDETALIFIYTIKKTFSFKYKGEKLTSHKSKSSGTSSKKRTTFQCYMLQCCPIHMSTSCVFTQGRIACFPSHLHWKGFSCL